MLKDVKDELMDMSLNEPLTFMEFRNAIKKLSIHKAPTLNGVSSNALKALDDDNTMIVFEIFSNYFERSYDIKEWQVLY